MECNVQRPLVRDCVIFAAERVHQFTLIYAILGLFTENESMFLIKFLIIADQIKLKYSLSSVVIKM